MTARRIAVMIASTLLAVALGLFVGSTSLQPTAAAQPSAAITNRLMHDLAAARAAQARAAAFDQTILPKVLHGELQGRPVLVVVQASVPSAVVAAMQSGVAAAGGVLTATVRLQPAMSDPDNDVFLRTLVRRLSATPPATGNGTARATALLASALTSHSPLAAGARSRVLAAYSAGGLIRVDPATPTTFGALVLVVPAGHQDAADAALADALDRGGDRVVAATPISADPAAGVIASVQRLAATT